MREGQHLRSADEHAPCVMHRIMSDAGTRIARMDVFMSLMLFNLWDLGVLLLLAMPCLRWL